MPASKPTTLYDKIWNDHLVHEAEDGTCLLYIDRHLVHEVTSPQAFEGLKLAHRTPRRARRSGTAPRMAAGQSAARMPAVGRRSFSTI